MHLSLFLLKHDLIVTIDSQYPTKSKNSDFCKMSLNTDESYHDFTRARAGVLDQSLQHEGYTVAFKSLLATWLTSGAGLLHSGCRRSPCILRSLHSAASLESRDPTQQCVDSIPYLCSLHSRCKTLGCFIGSRALSFIEGPLLL